MAGTKRNAGLLAVLRLLVIGVLILAFAVALTGTVAAFDRDPAKEFGQSSLSDSQNRDPRSIRPDGTTILPPLASVQGQTVSPHGVSGLVVVLGSPAVQGTLVEAWSPDGRVAEARVGPNGEYSLSIPVNTSTVGQPVTFTVDGSMVGGSMADSTVTLTSGADDSVDLNVDGCGRALPRPRATVTVSDILVSTCPSVSRPGSYAKYYYFVLDRSAEITIDMDSEVGAFGFDDYFYLKDSTGRYSTLGRNRDSGSLTAELPAGVYVIEATAFHTLTTGRYTLTVSGLPRVGDTPAPPLTAPPHGVSGLAEVLGIPAVQGTLVEAWSPLGRVAEALVDSNGEYSLSIPVNTSTAGQPVTFTMDGSMVGGSMAKSRSTWIARWEPSVSMITSTSRIPREGTAHLVETGTAVP